MIDEDNEEIEFSGFSKIVSVRSFYVVS